jgi:hypothetical protein
MGNLQKTIFHISYNPPQTRDTRNVRRERSTVDQENYKTSNLMTGSSIGWRSAKSAAIISGSHSLRPSCLLVMEHLDESDSDCDIRHGLSDLVRNHDALMMIEVDNMERDSA